MESYDRYVAGNRRLWDEWAEINFRSAFYDVAGFKAAPGTLEPLIVDGVGDVRGKSLLHLQCHFGMDTLRWARLGATVTGVDFSEKAIAYARQLAEEMGIAATFIQANVYDLPQVLDQRFDVVFTSYGVLSWLPDLRAWGHVISQSLNPGGIFSIVEAHPALMIFDETQPDELRVKFPYFESAEPLVLPPTGGNYADPSARVTETEYAWQHSLAEILTALLDAGLALEAFHEYPHVTWKALPFLVRDGAYWRLPPTYPSLPLSFAIRARKPADAPSDGM